MKLTSQEINRIRNNFSCLRNKEEKYNYIVDLYKNNYNYNDLARIFQTEKKKIVQILEYKDVKNCGNLSCPNENPQSRKNFHCHNNTADNLSNQCKTCTNNRAKNYQRANRNYRKEYLSEYYEKNKENLKLKFKKYHENNKDYLSERKKKEAISLAYYDSYAEHLYYAIKIRRDPQNSNLIQTKCTYCNIWFNPTNQQVRARIRALKGQEQSLGAENHLYCSNECKYSCPIYKQINYSRNDPRYLNTLSTSREIQPELRKMRFEKDNWTCQKCNCCKDDLPNEISLHCHHIEGILWEPIESADIDMCLTVCSECHKKIHSIPGCRKQDMECNY